MPGPAPPNPPPKRPGVVRMPTRLESVDDIRAAIQARQAEQLGGPATAPPPLPGAAPPVPPVAHAPGSPKTTVPHFKPSLRPPVPLLTVFDDASDDGEVVRIRGERFVIGRAEGDLLLPHDGQVSARHAELVRRQENDGSWAWELADLGSTNGTFVRAGAAVLKGGQEFLIGRTRYRFDEAQAPPPPPEAPAAADPAAPFRPTVTWNADHGLPGVPSVVELTRHGLGTRVPLIQPEYWIGSDRAACELTPLDDPFVSPRHARLSRDAKGRWQVINNRSVNGVWVRVEQTDLTGSCYFQVGEQRFSFKVSQP